MSKSSVLEKNRSEKCVCSGANKTSAQKRDLTEVLIYFSMFWLNLGSFFEPSLEFTATVITGHTDVLNNETCDDEKSVTSVC